MLPLIGGGIPWEFTGGMPLPGGMGGMPLLGGMLWELFGGMLFPGGIGGIPLVGGMLFPGGIGGMPVPGGIPLVGGPPIYAGCCVGYRRLKVEIGLVCSEA